MKKISILAFALSLGLMSCSSDDDNPVYVPEPTPAYAMTAKINGSTFEANNPFGNNEFSSTNIWSYYPEDDYLMLQGRAGGITGNPEINIWLKRSDLVVGTYPIGEETFDTPPSHFIDLIDNSNEISELTRDGVITITEVNTATKIVKGTFTFEAVDELSNTTGPADVTVTEGNFRYKYE